jgi:hypothetical protein
VEGCQVWRAKKNRKIAKIKFEKFKIRNLIGDMSDTLPGKVSSLYNASAKVINFGLSKSRDVVPVSNLLDLIEIFVYFILQSKIAALVNA